MAASQQANGADGSNGIASPGAATPRSTASTGVSMRRVRFSTTMALILAILGSSVLPMGYAFATTGILAGFLISLGVALCNTYTCRLLLNAACATHTTSFEGLAAAVGGRSFTAFAQASNIILLVGNITGDLCLLADLGAKSLVTALGDDTPEWLVAHHGRGIMVALTIAVIFPLSLCSGLRALEHTATAGVGVIMLLFAVLTGDAVRSGFRGVTSGEVPLWRWPRTGGHVAEAFALIGYSFYLHPLMMPMLRELPAGAAGIRVMAQSMTITILGVAMLVYTYVGAMGAAAFGAATEGDIVMNNLLPQRWAACAFVVVMLVYLAASIPPLVITLRSYVAYIVACGAHSPASPPLQRTVVLTVTLLALPLILAWRDPSLSEKAFSLTGATGVCIVCYVIPVAAHFRLMFARRPPARAQHAEALALAVHAPLLHLPDEEQPLPRRASLASSLQHLHDTEVDNMQPNSGDGANNDAYRYMRPPQSPWAWIAHVLFPVAVLCVGCALSGMALYSALQ